MVGWMDGCIGGWMVLCVSWINEYEFIWGDLGPVLASDPEHPRAQGSKTQREFDTTWRMTSRQLTTGSGTASWRQVAMSFVNSETGASHTDAVL